MFIEGVGDLLVVANGTEFVRVEELGGFDEALEVDLDREREGFGVRFHDDHVAGFDGGEIGRFVIHVEVDLPFDDDDLDVAVGIVFDEDGGAGDGGGDGSGADAGATELFRNLEEEDTLFEVDITSAFLQAEQGIGTEAGEGLVREFEFGAGADACGNGGATGDDVTDFSSGGVRLALDDADVIEDAGDFGCFEDGSGEETGGGEDEREQEEGGGFHGCSGLEFDADADATACGGGFVVESGNVGVVVSEVDGGVEFEPFFGLPGEGGGGELESVSAIDALVFEPGEAVVEGEDQGAEDFEVPDDVADVLITEELIDVGVEIPVAKHAEVEAISAVDEEGLLGADPSRGALIKILREFISGDAVVDDAAKKQSIAEFRNDVHEAGGSFKGFEVENIEFVVANDLLGKADVSVGTVADTGLPTGTDASAIEEVIDLTGRDVGGVVSPESERISKGPKESIFWHFLF